MMVAEEEHKARGGYEEMQPIQRIIAEDSV